MTIELDEVYTDEVALRAELERRIGSEVVSVSIKWIDYVRETMRVGVDYRPRPTHERSLFRSSQQAVSIDR